MQQIKRAFNIFKLNKVQKGNMPNFSKKTFAVDWKYIKIF